MEESEELGESVSNDEIDEDYTRLWQLKKTKYLTQRIFSRISENISYEIFKYMNFQDLLQIRALTLGGFQLVSNTTLRARIKNYIKDKVIPLTDLFINKRKITALFEQKGENLLSFESYDCREINELIQNLEYIPNLQSLNLSNIVY